MAQEFTSGRFKSWLDSGLPNAGGRLYTYASGTTTFKAAYTDATLATPCTYTSDGVGGQYIALNARGEAQVWLGTGAYTMVDKTALGVVLDLIDGIQDGATVSDAKLTAFAALLSAGTGSTLIGHTPGGADAPGTVESALLDGYTNALTLVTDSVIRAAIRAYTNTVDMTATIQAAIAKGKAVYLSAGRWHIDPSVGLVLSTGAVIFGDGLMRTIITLKPLGGSAFKRAFTPGVANDYVTGVNIRGISVQLNQGTNALGNYVQVGLDFRNITRSKIEDCHAGTLGIPGQPICPTPAGADTPQGYGFVFGTRSSGGIDYCGGEENVMRDCFAWGSLKPIVVDDDVLSPGSAANGTVIDNPDIQGGHVSCSQPQRYGAGLSVRNLTVQGATRNANSTLPTAATIFNGYDNDIHVKYAEMGADCDVIHQFGADSHHSLYSVQHYSYATPSAGAFIDSAGLTGKNRMRYGVPVSSGGSTNGTGPMYETYNAVPTLLYYKGGYVGSVFVVDAKAGITVSNVSAAVGDYWVNLDTPQPNANWVPQFTFDSNPSGNEIGYTVDTTTQSATQIRLFTFIQVGGTTTPVHPRRMFISIQQVN